MDASFAARPDSLLFGAQSDIARRTARRLDARIVRLARQMLPEERYALMERFVGEYLAEHPAPEGDAVDNTTLAWLEYLREHGVEHNYATGSIAEVLADVNDRVSGQTQQLSNTLGWSKDILEMQLRQDSLRLADRSAARFARARFRPYGRRGGAPARDLGPRAGGDERTGHAADLDDERLG